MTEIAVLVLLALVAVAFVYAAVARAGRDNDRRSEARRDELDALARMHDRRQP